MLLNDSDRISSALIGRAAYERASGKTSPRKMPAPHAQGSATGMTPEHSERASRELKASVLKSLHSRSNAGMVTIRDVSSALDQLLKGR